MFTSEVPRSRDLQAHSRSRMVYPTYALVSASPRSERHGHIGVAGGVPNNFDTIDARGSSHRDPYAVDEHHPHNLDKGSSSRVLLFQPNELSALQHHSLTNR